MLQEIRNQIDNINQSLAWIRKNKEEDYYQRFLQLVDNRRTLKKIESAIANNPGIAAFGKSQVGKSYLISCLLQGRDRDGKDVPFMVRAGNESYNFIYKINPPSQVKREEVKSQRVWSVAFRRSAVTRRFTMLTSLF